MCGICGKFGFEQDASVSRSLIAGMLDTIRHRGPDDQGIYLAPGLGLGHARLSIIDLASGHQPQVMARRHSGAIRAPTLQPSAKTQDAAGGVRRPADSGPVAWAEAWNGVRCRSACSARH